MIIQEHLRENDLRHFVKNIFEIDSHASKIGDDRNIVVLSFTVTDRDPANDLEHFIEMGYSFVLDADVSPGETDEGVYRVYVEIERSRKIAKQISYILYGMRKITGIDNFRFRYFKSFCSWPATLKNLTNIIPVNGQQYDHVTEKRRNDNVMEFFANSHLDRIIVEDCLELYRIWREPLKFMVVDSGPKNEIYEKYPGAICESADDMSEILYLTKYIGDYNITKIANNVILEKDNWAVVLKNAKY